MDELNLFIDYHYKSIVSIVTARHVLTLHLFPANWRKPKLSHYWQLLQERSCALCNFYQIESYHSSLRCNPVSMQINGTLILLYFKELTNHIRYQSLFSLTSSFSRVHFWNSHNNVRICVTLIGVCMWSIRSFYVNPKFGNNFGEFVRHRRDITGMTSHTDVW